MKALRHHTEGFVVEIWDERFWRDEIVAIAGTSGGQWQQALHSGYKSHGLNARTEQLESAIDGLLGRLTTEYTPVAKRLSPR